MPRKKRKAGSTASAEQPARVANPELVEFAQELASEESAPEKRGPGRPAKTPKEREEQRDEELQKYYREQAAAYIQALEEELKPALASLVFGKEKAEFFRAPRATWQRLVEPGARYLEAVKFQPESPTYHLVTLVTIWGLMTFEQWRAMSLAAQKKEPEDKKGWARAAVASIASIASLA